jgi:hypothetical protein
VTVVVVGGGDFGAEWELLPLAEEELGGGAPVPVLDGENGVAPALDDAPVCPVVPGVDDAPVVAELGDDVPRCCA